MDAPTIIELQPPSARARTWTFLLTVGLPMAAVAGSLAMHGPSRWRLWPSAGSPLADGAIVLATALLVLLLVWAAMVRAMRRHRLEVRDGALAVVAGFHRDRLALPELQLDQARIGTLGEHPEWKPFLKVNGTALPGFRGGWFRTRSWQRVFACMADGERVLWIPTTRKHALLLDARRPRELLEQLRAMAAPPPRR
ncbi:MAG TPA: hypothetical protein VLM17_10010 [Xanthomonadaceae bacterium]|nr:hypothetical protein [Xanthomonadaceae bacterium]